MTDTLPPEIAAALDANEDQSLSAADSATLEALVSKMMDLQDNKESLEGMLKQVNAELDDVRKRRLPEKMQELGLIDATGHGAFTHSSGAGVSLRVQVWASIAKTDEAGNPTDAYVNGVYKWLEDNGHGSLIKHSVHAQTFSAFVRERIEDGEPLPPGIKTSMETMAVVRRPKGESNT